MEKVLGVEHLTRLKASIKALDEAEAQMELAERAGIDVSDRREELSDIKARLVRIRSVYFPGQ